jgi:hypothetical protein
MTINHDNSGTDNRMERVWKNGDFKAFTCQHRKAWHMAWHPRHGAWAENIPRARAEMFPLIMVLGILSCPLRMSYW